MSSPEKADLIRAGPPAGSPDQNHLLAVLPLADFEEAFWTHVAELTRSRLLLADMSFWFRILREVPTLRHPDDRQKAPEKPSRKGHFSQIPVNEPTGDVPAEPGIDF